MLWVATVQTCNALLTCYSELGCAHISVSHAYKTDHERITSPSRYWIRCPLDMPTPGAPSSLLSPALPGLIGQGVLPPLGVRAVTRGVSHPDAALLFPQLDAAQAPVAPIGKRRAQPGPQTQPACVSHWEPPAARCRRRQALASLQVAASLTRRPPQRESQGGMPSFGFSAWRPWSLSSPPAGAAASPSPTWSAWRSSASGWRTTMPRSESATRRRSGPAACKHLPKLGKREHCAASPVHSGRKLRPALRCSPSVKALTAP